MKLNIVLVIPLTAILVFFLCINVFAGDCEEKCIQSKSCKEYVDCQVAELECLAACKQIESWEHLTLTLDNLSETFEKLIDKLNQGEQREMLEAKQKDDTWEKFMLTLDKFTEMSEKVILKLSGKEEAGSTESD